MILSYKYRLLPNKAQHAALAGILESQRILYNAALEERIDCYRKTGRGLSRFDQERSLTIIRREEPETYGAVGNRLGTATLDRLDGAFKSFFRRIKGGGKAGFPRFKSRDRWRSFGFIQWEGIRWSGRRLVVKGLPGTLRVHFHRDMPEGRPATCQFIRDGKGWSIAIQMHVDVPERRTISKPVGIDLGINTLAYLSDGVALPNPRVARKAERLVRIRARALSRCQRGSNRRRKVKANLAKAHSTIANTRRTYLHQQSAMLVRNYDLIAIEDINVKGLARTKLAKSVHDVAWSTFTQMLSYKAEKAGATVIRVDPRMTSQTCSGCGVIVRKGLADRVHNCPDCGLTLDRDHNAALNILRLGVLAQGELNAGHVAPKRARGNLKVVERPQ